MAIRYEVNVDKYGELTVYEKHPGDRDTVLYTIQYDKANDGYRLRAYPSGTIAYTLIKDKSNPVNYLVYEGSVVVYGSPIVYYVQRDYKPYTIVRRGDSVYGEEVFTVREGKGYSEPKYIVEDRETFGSGKLPDNSWGALDPVVNSKVGESFIGAVANPVGTIKENLKHPLKSFFGGYKDLFGSKSETAPVKNQPAEKPVSAQPTPQPTQPVNQKGNVPVTYYLPVGSVVLLKGATKRIAVTGYQTMDSSKPGKTFDYVGVLYPEGSLSSDQNLLFDHAQIDRIYFEGYKDEEYFKFMESLNRVITQR